MASRSSNSRVIGIVDFGADRRCRQHTAGRTIVRVKAGISAGPDRDQTDRTRLEGFMLRVSF